DVAEIVDVAESDAAAVSALLEQQRVDVVGELVLAAFAQLDDQVRAIAVIVDGQDVLLEAFLVEVLGAIDDLVDNRAAELAFDVVGGDVAAAAGIDEVVDTHARKILLLEEVENLG